MMTLLSIVLVLAVVGFALWLVLTLLPMPAPFPRVIVGVVCLFLLFWVLQNLGLVGTHLRLR